MDGAAWLTLIVSIVVGLGGGVIGAIIAAKSQARTSERAERGTAERALWDFQRALQDFASEAESHEIHDADSFTKTTREDLQSARAIAYQFRNYLPAEKSKLLSRHWFPVYQPGDNPLAVSEDLWAWAKDLENELVARFGEDHLK